MDSISLLSAKSKLTEFQWKIFIDHLFAKAPNMMRLISSIVAHSDHRNKKVVSDHYPGICMTFAVLLRETKRCVVCSH